MDAARIILAILIIAVLGTGAWFTGQRLESSFGQVSQKEDQYYLPSPAWLNVLSMGYQEALADLLWANAVVYFGEQLTESIVFRYHERYLDSVMELNPRFKGFYEWAGLLALFSKKKITRATAELSIKYLERGVKEFPSYGLLYFHLGFLYSYELVRFMKPEERPAYRRKGALMMRRAALLGGAPRYAGRTAATIMTDDGLDELATQHMIELLMTTSDEQTQAVFEIKLKDRIQEKVYRSLLSARKRMEDEWQKNLPFAPLDFYLALGPLPLVDNDELLDPLYISEQLLESDYDAQGEDEADHETSDIDYIDGGMRNDPTIYE